MSLSLRRTLLLTMLGLIPFAGSYAQNSFVVKKIEVEGLERISKETVINDLGIQIGEMVDSTETNKVIKSLYDSGFFRDIQLYQDGNTLIVKLVERPAISSVDFDGNDKIKNDDMRKVLREAGLDVGNIANPEVLFQVRQSLLMQYALMGYYSTTVDIQEVKESRNRVAIKINIAEGKTATVSRINVIGNKAYSESELLNNITFKTPSIWNLWGLFTSKAEYSPVNMQSSVEDLTNYYMNNGYLDFRVSSNQASLSPNKENAFIAFDISEGQIYKISKVSLEGQFVISKAELEKLITFKAGDIFSRQKVFDSAKSITQALGDKGYAFANVNPLPKVDKENRTVALTFYIDPGKKVYINQINFLGNNVTNDYVYRRQMQYFESGVYNQKMIDQSKIKLQRMPFVQDVTVNKVPVPGSDDLVNMNYDITERSANSVSASIGYSQLYKFMIGGNLSLPNILGTGNQFSIGANLSSVYQSLNMSYTDPFFTQSGVSQTISTYLSRTDYDNTSVASYRLNQYGANLGYSIPTSAFDSISIGGGVDHTQVLQPSGGQSSILQWFVNQNSGKTSFNTFTVNLGWNHNSTNRAFFPTEGTTLGINSTTSLPGISDLQWYKVIGSAGFFHPLIGDFTLSVKGGLGYGNGYGKTEYLPFFQNFYAGGWGSVRGFTQGGMGPMDTYIPNGGTVQQGNAIGGNLNIYTNIDILFPIPGIKDSQNMRLGVFFDAGNVYNTYSMPVYNATTNPNGPLWPEPTSPNSPTFSNLRYSVGVEFQWLSPLGPMAFSVAKPLNTKPGDSTQVFQFTLGQTF
ncbi:outer membrane protein assembly factor BamA [Fastidiosibacter lacustris]|uniref:outer membrane protein assembly factor BamA n=1 Tax=Fastidiosibacter lacustris TaxID=2056695 RepID=UPI000E34320A|nr:outer membrane protein assembly factor BamA [Fastidiosibacter lacustris]